MKAAIAAIREALAGIPVDALHEVAGTHFAALHAYITATLDVADAHAARTAKLAEEAAEAKRLEEEAKAAAAAAAEEEAQRLKEEAEAAAAAAAEGGEGAAE